MGVDLQTQHSQHALCLCLGVCSSICVFTENTNKVKKDSDKNDKAKEKWKGSDGFSSIVMQMPLLPQSAL